MPKAASASVRGITSISTRRSRRSAKRLYEPELYQRCVCERSQFTGYSETITASLESGANFNTDYITIKCSCVELLPRLYGGFAIIISKLIVVI